MAALMLRRTATVLSSCAVAAGIVMAPEAGAAPAAAPTVTDAVAQGCYTRDGYPPDGGRNIGGNPPKYKWDHTPYVGARYASCGRTVRLYYGGYTNNTTHYNVRYAPPGGGWQQTELRAGAHMMWKFPAAYGDYNFSVQACNRGGAFQSSRCTNWSPQLYLNTR
ncbi:hypothetical protein [Streptomyces sp. ALI-76-A]|uniref:hypothetical protein n=1 Tax=Streptomyces sp. ALI-76-A TaxID=3025736 RepID=UPI00256F2563|nr:hypothetical protein [Streptomyces sp. ALI-76-A]MDL5203792.1 hypothetical protein [Streptomyces sp. ALI-76-A]